MPSMPQTAACIVGLQSLLHSKAVMSDSASTVNCHRPAWFKGQQHRLLLLRTCFLFEYATSCALILHDFSLIMAMICCTWIVKNGNEWCIHNIACITLTLGLTAITVIPHESAARVLCAYTNLCFDHSVTLCQLHSQVPTSGCPD